MAFRKIIEIGVGALVGATIGLIIILLITFIKVNMQKEYSVTVKYAQTVNVIAEDAKGAIENAKSSLGVNEGKFGSIDYKVKPMKPKMDALDRTAKIPFKTKKPYFEKDA